MSKPEFHRIPQEELQVPLPMHASLPNQFDSLDHLFLHINAFLMLLAWIPLTSEREMN